MHDADDDQTMRNHEQTIRICETLSRGLTKIAGNLRHIYKHLNDETVIKQKEFANDLISPVIQSIEGLDKILKEAIENYNLVMHMMKPPH